MLLTSAHGTVSLIMPFYVVFKIMDYSQHHTAKRSSTLQRFERLELLKSRLKSGDVLTVSVIADEFGISPRTVNRDIALLREQGVPVEAERGRGGGIRLPARWGVGKIHFSFSEAVDLMITLAVAEQMKSPLFMANLSPVKRKLMACLTPQMRENVKQLKHRIRVLPSASANVLAGFNPPAPSVAEALHHGFLLQQTLTLHYRAGNGKTTKRLVEPHYLLLSYPVWYVLAFDHLRDEIRTFRCDRISKAILNPESFRLLPYKRFAKSIEGVTAI